MRLTLNWAKQCNLKILIIPIFTFQSMYEGVSKSKVTSPFSKNVYSRNMYIYIGNAGSHIYMLLFYIVTMPI